MMGSGMMQVLVTGAITTSATIPTSCPNTVVSNNWSLLPPSADVINWAANVSGMMAVGSNQLVANQSIAQMSYHSTASYNANQCAVATMSYQTSGAMNSQIGFGLRMDASADTFYGIRTVSVVSGIPYFDIFKHLAGVETILNSSQATCSVPATGDNLIAAASGSGPVAITVYDITTSTAICTASDNSSPITSGSVGVYGFGAEFNTELGSIVMGNL